MPSSCQIHFPVNVHVALQQFVLCLAVIWLFHVLKGSFRISYDWHPTASQKSSRTASGRLFRFFHQDPSSAVQQVTHFFHRSGVQSRLLVLVEWAAPSSFDLLFLWVFLGNSVHIFQDAQGSDLPPALMAFLTSAATKAPSLKNHAPCPSRSSRPSFSYCLASARQVSLPGAATFMHF